MITVELKERSLSLLRLLTSSCIDVEAAELLLEGEMLDVLLDLQAVMLVGMEAEERGGEELINPDLAYERYRSNMPEFGDLQEERQYLLQPDYKHYMKQGMRLLSLS